MPLGREVWPEQDPMGQANTSTTSWPSGGSGSPEKEEEEEGEGEEGVSESTVGDSWLKKSLHMSGSRRDRAEEDRTEESDGSLDQDDGFVPTQQTHSSPLKGLQVCN